MIPVEDLALVQAWCRANSPEHMADRIRVESHVDGNTVTLCETLPPWSGEGEWTHDEFAQLRYRPRLGDYELRWHDMHLRWRKYTPENIPPVAGSCEELLDEITADPWALFRG
ncbi:MAG TPA: hypothetical protein VFY86_02095 [Nocardioides sp.]|nr:hypothetical protein [uncultured Nocardioides sp.]HEX5985281.1 hypothetical protein [Nocardioides sp.]